MSSETPRTGAAEALKSSRWLKFFVALGVSAVFTWLFLRSVNLHDVGEALADANYVYVAPALGLFALSLVFRALRWRYFLQPEQDLGWRELLPSLLVGYAGNNLLPLRAGELLRAQHLADHRGVARMQTLGTMVMERLFDGLVLATFVLWGLLLVHVGTAYLGLGLLLAGGALGGFVACTVLARRPDLPGRIAQSLPFLAPQHRVALARWGDSFRSGFSVLTSPSRCLLAALTSAAAWGLELAMYWLIAQAFDLHASFITIAFAGSAANVAMSLPSAQGGVGPFQFFATQALLEFDIAQNAAAAYSLALHLFLVGPVSLVGLVVLWRSTLPGRRRVAAVSVPAAPLEAGD